MYIATAHNQDMVDNNFFDHDSSDGTDMGTRVWSVYSWQGSTGVAENITTRSDPREAVLEGWMCSSGHRANIQNDAYVHYGGAMFGGKGTQNFAYGDGGAPSAAIKQVMHEDHGATFDLYASVGTASVGGGTPDQVQVVVDGVAHDLSLAYGVDDQGVYTTTLADPGAGCHEYYARASIGGVWHHTPEEGSWGWGSCAFDDADAQWLDGQLPASDPSPPSLDVGPLVAGQSVDLVVDGAAPGTTVHFVLGTDVGQGPCPPALGGLCLGVSGNTRKLGDDSANGMGQAVLSWTVPAGAGGRDLTLQAVVDPGSGYVLTDVVEVTVQ